MFTKNFVRIIALVLGLVYGLRSHALGLLSIGLKGGSTLSSQFSKDALGNSMGGYTHGVGFIVGGGLDIGPGMIGLIIDALYTQRKVVYQVTDYQTSRSLHIPVLVRIKTGIFSLEFGGFYDTAIGEVNTNGVLSTYSAANMKQSDFGITGGLALAVPVGVARLTMEGRYNFGLQNQIVTPIGLQSNHSSSFDLLAGFYF